MGGLDLQDFKLSRGKGLGKHLPSPTAVSVKRMKSAMVLMTIHLIRGWALSLR